jgi:hypothetical protein
MRPLGSIPEENPVVELVRRFRRQIFSRSKTLMWGFIAAALFDSLGQSLDASDATTRAGIDGLGLSEPFSRQTTW